MGQRGQMIEFIRHQEKIFCIGLENAVSEAFGISAQTGYGGPKFVPEVGEVSCPTPLLLLQRRGKGIDRFGKMPDHA